MWLLQRSYRGETGYCQAERLRLVAGRCFRIALEAELLLHVFHWIKALALKQRLHMPPK